MSMILKTCLIKIPLIKVFVENNVGKEYVFF